MGLLEIPPSKKLSPIATMGVTILVMINYSLVVVLFPGTTSSPLQEDEFLQHQRNSSVIISI